MEKTIKVEMSEEEEACYHSGYKQGYYAGRACQLKKEMGEALETLRQQSYTKGYEAGRKQMRRELTGQHATDDTDSEQPQQHKEFQDGIRFAVNTLQELGCKACRMHSICKRFGAQFAVGACLFGGSMEEIISEAYGRLNLDA